MYLKLLYSKKGRGSAAYSLAPHRNSRPLGAHFFLATSLLQRLQRTSFPFCFVHLPPLLPQPGQFAGVLVGKVVPCPLFLAALAAWAVSVLSALDFFLPIILPPKGFLVVESFNFGQIY